MGDGWIEITMSILAIAKANKELVATTYTIIWCEFNRIISLITYIIYWLYDFQI